MSDFSKLVALLSLLHVSLILTTNPIEGILTEVVSDTEIQKSKRDVPMKQTEHDKLKYMNVMIIPI